MTRILIVNTVPTERNGITNVMLNYYCAMDKHDLKIDFVFINQPTKYYLDLLSKNNSKYYILSRSMSNIFFYAYNIYKIARNYDVIHVHGNSATMAFEIIAARLAGTKRRLAHGHSSSCKYRVLDKILRIPLYLFCNERISCGDKAGKWLYGKLEYKLLKNGIITSKYIFNESMRQHIRVKESWDEKTIVIGHIGNFLAVKNHSFLLELFSKLTKIDERYRLALIGSGPLLYQTQQLAQNLGITDKVSFLGSISNVNEYLNAIDIVIMPSLYEGFPLTLIEEQACGLRCIVSDVISEETNITGNVFYLSLSNNNQDNWINLLQQIIDTQQNRTDLSKRAVQQIRDSGYDMTELSNDLKTLYLIKDS